MTTALRDVKVMGDVDKNWWVVVVKALLGWFQRITGGTELK